MRKSEKDKRALASDEPVYLTAGGIEKLKKQIVRIERDLPEAIAELQRTREMGDLSENAAYQQAKHQVRRMQGKLFHLQERLKNVIQIETQHGDTAQLGSTVTVNLGGEEKIFEIVGPLETDPLRGRISHESPIGKLIIGSKEGDELLLNDKPLKIVSID